MDKLESMLDSFYDLEDAETAAKNSADIDSSAFDVAASASEVIAKTPLPGLISYASNLDADVKSLDRDMQDLVYNNYSKFIGATETIRRMKDSVGEMETRMSTLVKEMRQMGGSSALVNGNLQANRASIEKLVGVKRLLLKLEFLFELPFRLRRSMELDAHGQAVRYYTMVSGVLRKYDSIPSLHKIRVEADAIMNALRGELRAVLRDRSGASAGRVIESIRLLVQLDEPRPALRSAFLAFQRSRLLAALQQVEARYPQKQPQPGASEAPSSQADAPGGSSSAATSSLISSRAAAFLASAGSGAASAAAAAPVIQVASASRARAQVPAYVFLQSLNRGFLDGFKYAVDQFGELFEESEPPGLARSSAHDELVAFSKDVFAEYFALVRRQLSLPPPLRDEAGEAAAAAPAPSTKRAAATGKAGGAAAAAAAVEQQAADADEDDEEAAAERLKAAVLAAVAAEATDGGASAAKRGRFASVADALQLLLTDVRTAARNVREAQLGDRAHEVTEAVLRAQLDGLFADVRGDVVALLAALHARTAALLEAEKARSVRATAPPGAASLSLADSGAAEDAAPPGSSSSSGTGNPFSVSAVTTAMAAAAAQSRASGRPAPAGVAAQYDWIAAVGAGLAAAGESASAEVSTRLDEALTEARPLILSGMRLLPELARVFSSLVHGQVLTMLSWLAAAWEALGDPCHPCRAEFAGLVVEADLGLHAPGGGGDGGQGSGQGGRGAAAARQGALRRQPNLEAGVMRRRVAVDFSGAGRPLVPDESQPAFLLLLAVLCRHFSTNGVARALSTMLAALPTHADLQAMGVSLADLDTDGGSYGSMMDVPDLIRRTQASGRELLRRFVFYHGLRLSAVVRRSLASPSSPSPSPEEPRDVRLATVLILEDAALVRKLVACTLGEWDGAAAAAACRFLGVGTEFAAAAAAASQPQQQAPVASAANPFGPAPTAAAATAASSSNPFGPTAAPPAAPPPASSALVSSGGNPFGPAADVPTPPVRAGMGAAAGVSPQALFIAQATRRTGLIVGATGISSSFGSLGGGGSSGGAAAAAPGAASGTHADIDRLFSAAPMDPPPEAAGSRAHSSSSGGGVGGRGGSAAVLGAVDFSSDSVARALMRVVLKAWVEWLRAATLGKAAFQQAQVDLAALHLALPYLAGMPAPPPGGGSAAAALDPYIHAGTLEEMVNEAATAAAERCADGPGGAALDAGVLYAIVSARLARLNFSL